MNAATMSHELIAASKTSCIAAALVLVPAFSTSAATFNPGDLGSARDYSVVSLGATSSIKINSGPIAGDVLLGQYAGGDSVDFSGGGNGGINGTLFYDSTLTANDIDEFDDLENSVTSSLVGNSVTAQVKADAEAASAAASALTANSVFSSNIVGIGGLNIFSLTELKNEEFTITGTNSDFFVFNVSGAVDTNKAMTLSGVDASQILWNLTGTGDVFKTAGGNELFGTFLATEGGDFQFSGLDLDGALINTAGHVQFVSNSSLEFTSVVPIPAAAWLFASALGVFGYLGKRKAAA